MTRLQELEKAYWAAYGARSTMEDERAARRRAAITEFTRQLDDELAREYDAPLQELRRAEHAAALERDAEKERAALEGGSKIPAGTIMLEFDYPRYADRRASNRRLTGKRGVVEIVTRASEHPGNVGTYRQAAVGEVVIRRLKKDGSPSKAYERGWDARNCWLPEGRDLQGWGGESEWLDLEEPS